MRLLAQTISAAAIAALLVVLPSCTTSTPIQTDSHRDGAGLTAASGALAAGNSAISSPSTAATPAGPNDITAGQILVKFAPGASLEQIAAAHAVAGGSRISTISGLDVQVVRVAVGSERAAVAAYAKQPGVVYAEPDYILKAVFTPNDTSFASRQWDMTKINCQQAWDVTQGSNTIRVADLDTGIDISHPEFVGKVVLSKNFTSTSTSVADGNGHGTHTAGTIAAATNNALGVAGVGFNSVLLIGKVLGNGGSGSLSGIASGVTWASDNGAKVINMSLGSTAGSTTLQSAVDYAWNRGAVICAAAGNSGVSSPFYPAYYTNCIAIGSTTSTDARSSFSNWGTWVDVAAPGSGIYSTYKNGGYRTLDGTSMACPHVAGLAALIWSSSFGTSPADVRARIETTGDTITTDKPIGKRINAARAVGAIP